MKTIFTLWCLILLATPAHADVIEESDASYYGRQMQSCLYEKPRSSIWDLFAATRPVYLDECCASSVRAMESEQGKRIAQEDECGEGTVKHTLNCKTAKHWCAPKP
jgi:hypothetical protein